MVYDISPFNCPLGTYLALPSKEHAHAEQLSIEMEGLCGQERDVVNRFEALLEKHLQERFKSKGAELLSVSMFF